MAEVETFQPLPPGRTLLRLTETPVESSRSHIADEEYAASQAAILGGYIPGCTVEMSTPEGLYVSFEVPGFMGVPTPEEWQDVAALGVYDGETASAFFEGLGYQFVAP